AVPRSGHKKDKSFPLLYIVRDILKFANNSKEVKAILRNNNVLVDGKVRKDTNFGVGLMDVIAFPKIEKYYRVLPSKTKKLQLKEISKEEAKIKLAKIIRKKMIKHGNLQITTHDGYTFLIKKEDKENFNKFNTKDVIVFDITDKKRKIIDVLKFEINKIAMIVEGKNATYVGNIKEIKKGTQLTRSTTKVGDIETDTDYVFVIGNEKPLIQV
ncbi:MAG: 30S ribosomal protein S4e, partial [Candidatus Altarchaeaceae archaeon]